MNTIRATYRCARAAGWPLERALFALAGTVIVTSVTLAQVASPWFSALTLVVGLNQWLYAAVGTCPASFMLSRALHLRSALYGRDSNARPATLPRDESPEATRAS
jgi:hypothetical protein